MTPRIGSLCSGYGGLDLGLMAVVGGSVAWHVEYDKHPSAVLDARFPGVPNYGDVTTTDWSQVEPVDWLTAGYPCQPFSHAGKRKGKDDERHLWPFVADAIGVLRPGRVLLENVAGHVSLGLDAVLWDLAALGYDTTWGVVRAADAGAPHNRARILKHEPGRAWLEANAPDALVVVGIAWWEQHRRAGIAAGHAPRRVWFPMTEAPYVDNDDMGRLARSYGVEPPRMYAAGYEHSNCSGACFRAGHAAWARLLEDSPDLFAWHELMEHHWRRTVGKFAAVLKWRSGPLDGQPMTLQTLRRLKTTGQTSLLDLDDWGGCGCVPGDSGGVLIPTIGLREAS